MTPINLALRAMVARNRAIGIGNGDDVGPWPVVLVQHCGARWRVDFESELDIVGFHMECCKCGGFAEII